MKFIALFIALITSLFDKEPVPPRQVYPDPEKVTIANIEIPIWPVAKTKPPQNLVEALAAFAIEPRSGATLFEKNSDTAVPIASLTKLATAIVARERLPLDKVLTVPEKVSSLEDRRQVRFLAPGMKLSVSTLLAAALIASDNAAAVTLASEDEEGFIRAMNALARDLRLEKTRFVEPSGLAVENISTAREIARLAQVALDDPVIAALVKLREYDVKDAHGNIIRTIRTTNKLAQKDPSILGVKTGFTEEAGLSLIALRSFGHYEILTVVLKSPDQFAETQRLFDYLSNAYDFGLPL